jgi:hypothetical protein
MLKEIRKATRRTRDAVTRDIEDRGARKSDASPARKLMMEIAESSSADAANAIVELVREIITDSGLSCNFHEPPLTDSDLESVCPRVVPVEKGCVLMATQDYGPFSELEMLVAAGTRAGRSSALVMDGADRLKVVEFNGCGSLLLLDGVFSLVSDEEVVDFATMFLEKKHLAFTAAHALYSTGPYDFSWVSMFDE